VTLRFRFVDRATAKQFSSRHPLISGKQPIPDVQAGDTANIVASVANDPAKISLATSPSVRGGCADPPIDRVLDALVARRSDID
jgi:hypothetical protein